MATKHPAPPRKKKKNKNRVSRKPSYAHELKGFNISKILIQYKLMQRITVSSIKFPIIIFTEVEKNPF